MNESTDEAGLRQRLTVLSRGPDLRGPARDEGRPAPDPVDRRFAADRPERACRPVERIFVRRRPQVDVSRPGAATAARVGLPPVNRSVAIWATPSQAVRVARSEATAAVQPQIRPIEHARGKLPYGKCSLCARHGIDTRVGSDAFAGRVRNLHVGPCFNAGRQQVPEPQGSQGIGQIE